MYSAKWIDGQSKYIKQGNESWKKSEPEPINVALKRLNGSQNMFASKYLNEVCLYYNFKITIINLFRFNVIA